MLMTENLPVLAQRIGGDLVEVLGWKQHQLLPVQVKYAIAKFVQNNPELNTIQRVDFLADLAGFHGQALNEDVAYLVNDYGVETVYLAVDYLYQSGERSRTEQSFEDIETSIQALANLADVGILLFDSERLDYYLSQLGGFRAVADMSLPDLREKIIEMNSR
jgi:hypothetical protein